MTFIPIKFTPGFKLAGELCDVLGLDKMTVARIEFTLTPSDVVSVKVTHLIPDTKAHQVREVIERYRLISENEFQLVKDKRT
jgi:hypothetical protein